MQLGFKFMFAVALIVTTSVNGPAIAGLTAGIGDDLGDWPPYDMRIREQLRENAEGRETPSYHSVFRPRSAIRTHVMETNSDLDETRKGIGIVEAEISRLKTEHGNSSKLITLLAGLSSLQLFHGQIVKGRSTFLEALGLYEKLPISDSKIQEASSVLWSTAKQLIVRSGIEVDAGVKQLAKIYGKKEGVSGFNNTNPFVEYCQVEGLQMLQSRVLHIIERSDKKTRR